MNRPSGNSRASKASAYPISASNPRSALTWSGGCRRQLFGFGSRPPGLDPPQFLDAIANLEWRTTICGNRRYCVILILLESDWLAASAYFHPDTS